MTMRDFFDAHPEAAIGFSGGVDSAYLLYEASRHCRRCWAYYVKSPFQPAFELADARRLARELGVPMTVLPVEILEVPGVAANPANRCYLCKRVIFSAIQAQAKADGFSVLLDGTNASDQVSDRPGMRALEELAVLSPLRLCGLTKQEIRDRSRAAGLFTWDKPAYACLATRIPTGEEITLEKLAAVEQTEAFLMELGFSDFRVRTTGSTARLQLRRDQLPQLLEYREKILKTLKQWYQSVVLDLEVRL